MNVDQMLQGPWRLTAAKRVVGWLDRAHDKLAVGSMPRLAGYADIAARAVANQACAPWEPLVAGFSDEALSHFAENAPEGRATTKARHRLLVRAIERATQAKLEARYAPPPESHEGGDLPAQASDNPVVPVAAHLGQALREVLAYSRHCAEHAIPHSVEESTDVDGANRIHAFIEGTEELRRPDLEYRVLWRDAPPDHPERFLPVADPVPAEQVSMSHRPRFAS